MKKAVFHITTLFLILFASCDEKVKKDENNRRTQTKALDNSNSKSNLDWNGTYTGVLPCADCEGIQVSLTLFKSGAYQKQTMYLGKEEQGTGTNGFFEWNDAGSAITIKEENNIRSYQVGENMLFHLDNEGKKIDGDLAERYVLTKNLTDVDLEDKEWQLFEIRGQGIVGPEGVIQPNITFHSELSKVTGHNGCNTFTCSYELKTGKRISLGNIASTLMACRNMEMGDSFNEVLQKIDNYSIAGDSILSLNKARMAPLVRFKLKIEK
ncbi:MAG: copper resistance protein NlpE N-terminal domain-containing protein [Flavobacteriaceae bacterium]|nr:copper resistance protein NlpE N-terminal domain-containing protein [Flavobacteriaceae bacterium]NQZ45429.1 copper resistance protein NlpE N-terminal domain-containing protein [Flavobacteriaceae bacterium]